MSYRGGGTAAGGSTGGGSGISGSGVGRGPESGCGSPVGGCRKGAAEAGGGVGVGWPVA
jgi:hypothetical protein